MEQREKLAKLICEATQKTNYACTTKCKKEGLCAYCLVMAEHLCDNNVVIHPFKTHFFDLANIETSVVCNPSKDEPTLKERES